MDDLQTAVTSAGGGNRITLFRNGSAFFESLLADIRGSAEEILLETYIFENDKTGLEILGELTESAAAGRTVRLIYDQVGSLEAHSRGIFTRLEEVAAETHAFNPLGLGRFLPRSWSEALALFRRDHRKLAVIDSKIMYIGGMNIGGSFLDWEDVHLRIEGPLALAARESFYRVWKTDPTRSGSFPTFKRIMYGLQPAGPQPDLQIIDSIPDKGKSPIRKLYLAGLRRAKHRIRLAQSYFIPGRKVIRTLIKKAMSGVAVEIIVPDVSDVKIVDYAGEYCHYRLLRNGIRIFRFEGATLHSKLALVDDSWATVGSANIDSMGFHINLESNIVTRDAELVKMLNGVFESNLRNAREVTLEEWKGRSFMRKFLSWLFYQLKGIL